MGWLQFRFHTFPMTLPITRVDATPRIQQANSTIAATRVDSSLPTLKFVWTTNIFLRLMTCRCGLKELKAILIWRSSGLEQALLLVWYEFEQSQTVFDML